jgi:hypothetical protein
MFGADAYNQLVVSYQNGAGVRLGQVARVYDDVENNRLAAWMDGKRAVLMIIRRQPGANILRTIDGVKAALPRLKQAISPAIDMTLAMDRTTTIRASVRDVEITLLLSVLLVTAVVFVFLRSVRATAIPSVAVPLSLVGTFGVMYLLDYSIDNLSLMALTISTGFVVDDAIVVTENIARLVESGKPPLTAALEGARQIGFTIISITVSLIAVFIPILFMGGIVGRLFREFAVTLSIAVGISALVSLTVTPAMAGRLLRAPRQQQEGRVGDASGRFLARLTRGYDRALGWTLDHSLLMALLTVATLGLTIFLAFVVPKGLFPQQDTGLISGFSEAAQDISSGAMQHAQSMVNRIVHDDPDVEHVLSFVGGAQGAGNTGTVFVALRPHDKRKSTADEIVGRLRPKLSTVPGITLFLQSVQDMRVGGRASRTQYQYALQDADLDELATWSPRVLERLRKVPELRDVNTDQQTAGIQVNVDIDRDRAARQGIRIQTIDDTLYDAFGQRQVATSFTPLNYYRVVMEATPAQQASPDQLTHVYLRASDGALVPLSSIARFGISPTPLSILVQPRAGDRARAGGHRDPRRRTTDRPPRDGARQLSGHRAGVRRVTQQRAMADSRRAVHRLCRARHPVREPHPPDHDHLHPALGGAWRADRPAPAARRVQHHRAHRRRAAARHRQEERDHDDRLRARGRTRRGTGPEDGDPPRRLAPLPPDLDDDAGRPLRRAADGDRPRRRVGAAPAPGHQHRRGALRFADPQPVLDTGHLPLPRPVATSARAGAGIRARVAGGADEAGSISERAVRRRRPGGRTSPGGSRASTDGGRARRGAQGRHRRPAW